MNAGPTPPGEIAGWPKLVIRYPSDPAAVDALLPPGLHRVGEPTVQIGVYCVPVHDEPEYGVSVRIPARYEGIDGQYTLGIGIDQESAIFISRDTNGQPKYPCSVRFFRHGDRVEASAHHQGTTFMTYSGRVEATEAVDGEEFEENEWWIKYSRAVGGADRCYDLPPRLVRVRQRGVPVRLEPLAGRLELRSSPWDPVADLLPVHGEVQAHLVTNRHTLREITVAGPLDPEAFWPHTDTVGGSRWPGVRGGPRPTATAGATS